MKIVSVREAKTNQLTQDLEDYRAAREIEMAAKKLRIDEEFQTRAEAPRARMPIHIDYEDKAAMLIQARVRMLAARKRVSGLREEKMFAQMGKQLAASIVIGKFARGRRVRVQMKARAEELREFEAEQAEIAQEALDVLLIDDVQELKEILPELEDIDRAVQLERGRSLLHVATGKLNLAAVEAVLREGADPGVRDVDGQTAVDIAEALVFFHKTRGARNAKAMDNASRVYHLLELAGDPDSAQLRGDTAPSRPGTADETVDVRHALYGETVWKFGAMDETNVDVRSYVSEVRAQAEAEDAARNYQPSAAEQRAEMGISMRLQAEDQAEEAAIAEITSPLQATALLASIMASAFASAEDAGAGDAQFQTSRFSGYDYDAGESSPQSTALAL